MRVRGYAPATPCWAELISSDPASAIEFYQRLFGWSVSTSEVGTTVFTLRDLAVAGVTQAPGHAAWLTYVSIEDIDSTVAAASAAGGNVISQPMEVGPRGRAALLTDTEGAVFGVWQRGTFAGAQVVSEPNAVCWNEVASWDAAGAVTFYGKVFGWVDLPGSIDVGFPYREWQVANRVVGGMSPMSDPPFPADTPPHWRITLEVDVCADIVARCAQLGGTVLMGPIDVGVGQYAQLLDPQGATVGVVDLLPQFRLSP